MSTSEERRRSGDIKPLSASSQRSGSAPVRWIIANTLLAGLLILLAPDPIVTVLIGGSAIGLAAVTGAHIARTRTAATRTATLLDVMTAWLPGIAAVALAVVGLALVLRNPDNEILRLAGIALFLVQILFVAVLSALPDRASEAANRSPVGRPV
jgi:hypothetical protein